MKQVKTFEGFLDLFKSKSDIEVKLQSILKKLEECKDSEECPYKVTYYGLTKDIEWIKSPSVQNKFTYIGVKIDGVEIVVGSFFAYLEDSNYIIYMRKENSGDSVGPLNGISKSIKEKLWSTLYEIVKNKKMYDQVLILRRMINPSADLL